MIIIQLLVHIVVILLIFYILAKICDQYFVKSLDFIANKLKMPQDVAGATLMAAGSSSPELFIASFAILRNVEEVGTGTIVGSAIFNLLFILGVSSIAGKIIIRKKIFFRDIFFYLVSIIVLFLSFYDGVITLLEGSLFVLVYIVYIIILVLWEKFDKAEHFEFIDDTEVFYNKRIIDKIFPKVFLNLRSSIIIFIISLITIAALSYVMLEFATSLANILAIPPAVVALTIIAAGSSIPDLISSVIVARKGRGSMAFSNAIGSNIFNILIALGTPWFIYNLIYRKNVFVDTSDLNSSIIVLIATVVVTLLIMIFNKFRLTKNWGIVLIGIYILYLAYSIYHIIFEI